ncbi:phosphoethanolamine--lipid A transferase [Pseudomonas sp. ZM23]|uniref:Phosphoethanolamine--lipid A transferase n=1 Tax=Pseudomonas triclosanedens TaxID=2961893 RepID=A0ABY7A3S8_9PSED|nr:phosphoethanolamine--lipid A transferase [Pseudomonas triclosanedens]MCP8464336.1 phosphoethanolamine--lipid A transferase [Pseudomonas triclosanedens]MCP8471470.1 phosphoethanolamine--lipid A transferase [Pseudomonas triclosanedens]MCP8477721.1 phosphoethanolamine--lipid A transferase [Pseudomonas triclosanedens]WAI51176.1 phosphoethanolamine--lipid A transferase [Pseudomonas triclosanedens]
MAEGKRRLFPQISSNRLVLLFSLALVLFYNVATWKALNNLVPMQGAKSVAFFVSFAFFLWAAFTLLLTLVSFRPLLKPALTLVALVSAGAAYFMNTYGVVIDTVMVQNVFETNPGEAAALFSARMVGYLLVLGVLPAAIIWLTPVTYRPFFRGLLGKVLVVVGCVVVIAVSVGSFYSTYAPVFRQEDKLTHFINPTNYIYAVGKYTKQRLGIKENLVVQPIGEDAVMARRVRADGKKSLMIFVVGETARADHFSLNGYARETNPELSKLDIINFPNVSSCGTSTAVSVPCMFSKFPREDYSDKKGKTYQGLLDVLQRVGVSVLWLDNNSDCKGTCLRVPNRDIPKNQPGPFCDGKNCLDEAMLQNLQSYIDGLKDDAIIVLHADGSHGPEYYDRYPKSMERFTPVCRTNQLGSCSTEELVNVYDNTILYTDFFLSRVVELLRHNEGRFDASMVYVSDHGESLGENGVYLHAAPYAIAPKAQTHVPMVMWFGNGALGSLGIDRGCLEGKAKADELSHDNLFHSVLGLYGVRTSLYQPDLDIFHSCRRNMTVAQ